ncbi:hypothetical protein [Saliniramus fredricksonii]|uniref:Uncharacterized protein n=1 Tax=Saliniramus fredricksonii TaxID=1653334 RepID=A0ABY0K4P2_9HYPH|nr:hypothetical protein [Saliniramus fredricksonii]SCC78508.1 hypothetical protein GA0071312_0329 [Saliniramus fredricksonii]
MGQLNKLALRNVHRQVHVDPITSRREKLVRAIHLQKQVLAARLKGETYTVERRKRVRNTEGELVWANTQKPVRAWFFEQDGGWYVQCRYGARVLLVDGKHNAVFVPKLDQELCGILGDTA